MKTKSYRMLFLLVALAEFVMYAVVLDALWTASQRSWPAIVFIFITTLSEAKSCSDELKEL